MATKKELKEYFSTGKIPTAAQFGELIDYNNVITIVPEYNTSDSWVSFVFTIGYIPNDGDNNYTFRVPVSYTKITYHTGTCNITIFRLANTIDIDSFEHDWLDLENNITPIGDMFKVSEDNGTLLENLTAYFVTI
jgi:hypothetical protein